MMDIESKQTYCHFGFKIMLLLLVFMIHSAHAFDCVLDEDGDGVGDGTSGASSTISGDTLACGANSSASLGFSTAVGQFASAVAGSVAIGGNSSASSTQSTALGYFASALGVVSVAVGQSTDAKSEGSTALGQDTDIDDMSADSVALGHDAKITNAPGGIAIGADLNADNTGATATASTAIAIGADASASAPGAIAIGANVVASKENTMTVGVPIEVVRAETANVLVEDTSPTTIARTLFEIKNNGNTKFTVSNSAAMEQWSFANPGTGFRLSRQDSGVVEFEVKNNGNAVLAGTLTENSDVNSKQDIQALDQQAILDKVMDLDISEWRYKDDPASKHIGPMAQDFYQAFELGDTDKGISSIDTGGVALAAIQALKNENQLTQLALAEKDNEIGELKTQISTLTTLVEGLLARSQ